MAIYESLGTARLAQDELAVLETTLEQRVTGLAEHWRNFTDGLEPEFLAYFMLEHPDHKAMRKQFIEQVQATPELPYPNRQAVLKTGRAVLWAFSNTYEDGTPYDVMYVGQHVELVQ